MVLIGGPGPHHDAPVPAPAPAGEAGVATREGGEGGQEPVRPGQVATPDQDQDEDEAEQDEEEQDEEEREAVPARGLRASVGGWVRRHRVVAIVAAGAVVAGLGGGGYLLSRGSGSAGSTPVHYVSFHSARDGFTISYPRTWKRVTPTDPSVPLLVSAGGQDAMSIRVIQLQSAVNTTNISSLKSVTDSILSASPDKLSVLTSKAVSVNGIGGYFYVYTFSVDPTNPTGPTVVHAHYFLFQGRKLIILVFQAEPSSDFLHLAATFDKVLSTLTSNPAVLGPVPPPSSPAPGPSTPAGG